MADTGFSVSETTNPGYFDLINQILTKGGPQWDFNRANTTLSQYGNDFFQQFQNDVGRAPTSDEINQFFSQAVNPVMGSSAGFGGTDPNAVVQSYLPQAYQTQIQQNQQAQLNNPTTGIGAQIANLGNQVGATTAKDLADPNNPIYQAFAGGMNNLGITPSSGAFQSGIGSTIGNAISNTEQQGLSSLGLGAIGGNQSPSFQSLYGQGQQAQQGITGYNQAINNFDMQSQLAQMLQQMGQPSGFQTALGEAGAASKAFGNVAPGATALGSQMTSYICKELIKRDLLCESDMDDFHVHIMPAMFKKGRAFWKYAMSGHKLVQAVNEKGMDWKVFKPLLFDRVMEEADPCKAVDLYADACHQLCISADRSLWDQRVYRTSVWDSLIFLPGLFFYTPFLKALWKCVVVKTAFVYDKPTCEAHRG